MRFRACAVAAIAPNMALRVEPPDRQGITVYNLRGEFFASDDACTHKWASLAMGEINGDYVICPWHGGAFDIRSGAACAAPCVKSLSTYAVEVDNGELFIVLD